jgi:CDP-diacylglycerol---glycerol-3-phosphate 3-phosphatidyltransferase
MLSRLFKNEYSRLLHPLSLLLVKAGVSPNFLTLVGLLLSLAAGAAYAGGRLRLGGFLLLFSGCGDMLDGCLARCAGQSSRFGAFIDSVTDRYAEFFYFSGLLLWLVETGDRTHLLVLLAALMGSVMVSYTRARAESLIGSCEVGIMERPERMVVLIAGSLFGFVKPALWILAFGANLTALHRIFHTWSATRRSPA